jgi:hypothetical protein
VIQTVLHYFHALNISAPLEKRMDNNTPLALVPTEKSAWRDKLATAGLGSEASRLAADIAINKMKVTGEIYRWSDERTVREDRKWDAS